MTLQLERLRTIEQIEAFVAGSAPVDCKPLDRESAHDFVRRTLVAFDYHRLAKAPLIRAGPPDSKAIVFCSSQVFHSGVRCADAQGTRAMSRGGPVRYKGGEEYVERDLDAMEIERRDRQVRHLLRQARYFNLVLVPAEPAA